MVFFFPKWGKEVNVVLGLKFLFLKKKEKKKKVNLLGCINDIWYFVKSFKNIVVYNFGFYWRMGYSNWLKKDWTPRV